MCIHTRVYFSVLELSFWALKLTFWVLELTFRALETTFWVVGVLFETLWLTFRAAEARAAQKECPWTIFLEMGRPGGTPKETFSNTFIDILRKGLFRKTLFSCRRNHCFDHLGCAGIMFFRHQQPLTNGTRPKHQPSAPPPLQECPRPLARCGDPPDRKSHFEWNLKALVHNLSHLRQTFEPHAWETDILAQNYV